MKFVLKIFLLFALIASASFAQTKSNYEIFGGLIKESVRKISAESDLQSKTVRVDIRVTPGYESFSNLILSAFMKNSGKVSLEKGAGADISFNLGSLKVYYGNVDKDGLFGDYSVDRNFEVSGDCSIYESGELTAASGFEQKFDDVINYDELDTVENPAFPFTQGNRPEEPFLTGLVEPAIVIGTAIVTIILFFSVRSG